MKEKLFTTGQVAKALNVIAPQLTNKNILNYVEQGIINAYVSPVKHRRSGGWNWVSKDEIKRFLTHELCVGLDQARLVWDELLRIETTPFRKSPTRKKNKVLNNLAIG
jgi:hypothetical protein